MAILFEWKQINLAWSGKTGWRASWRIPRGELQWDLIGG